MDSDSTVPPPRPLPSLPVEVHQHLLRLCDAPTLAVSSRVSFAFLELASPLLYNDIDITLGKQTERLFCSRDPALDQPQLHPYLDLRHAHSITIRAASSSYSDAFKLSRDRLSSRSLAVDVLTLRPIGHPLASARPSYPPWSALYPIFAPIEVRLHGLPSPVPTTPPRISVEDASTWATCVRRVVLTDVLHRSFVGRGEYVPPGVTEPPLEIVFDLSSWDPDKDEGDDLLETVESECTHELSPVGMERCRANKGGGRVEKFVFQLRSEKARIQWEEDQRNHWRMNEKDEDRVWLEDQVKAGTIRFEVVPT